MPKIRIKERDLTTNPLVGSNTNYILYVLSEEQNNLLKGVASGENEDLYNLYNLHIFKAPYEVSASEIALIEGYESSEKKKIVSNSFLSEAVSLGGRVVIATDWEQAKSYCGDRNQYDIKFILAKELSEDDSKYTHEELQNALTIAQKRKDCVVVYTKIQPKYDETKEFTSEGKEEKDTSEKDLLKQKCTYIGNTSDTNVDKRFFSDEVKQPVGKYVLPFYAKEGVHDIDNPNITLDAGQAYILAFLNNVAQGRAEWLAIAGSTRGAIPGSYEVDGFLKEEEIDNMQLRTYDSTNPIAINPIVNMNPWGTRIWGNRTCLPNTNVTTDDKVADSTNSNVAKSPTDQLVASSFANIRIAICDIKKAIYKAARRYQFEQNTDVLWVNFTSSVNSLLEEMKSSYGIVGYRWKRDSANEQRGELRAILQITPIEAVEDYAITIELKDSLDNNVQIAE